MTEVGDPKAVRKENPLGAAVLAGADLLLTNTCPKCGEAKKLDKVLVEGWEDTGMTLTGKQTWTIRSMEVPGYCSSCLHGISIRRWLATLALAAPLLFCFFLGGRGTAASGYSLIGLFYGFYVLKKISYAWSDWLLYGMELELNLGGRLEGVRRENASMRFPLGYLSSFLRFVFIAGMSFLALFLGGIWNDSGNRPVPQSSATTEEPRSLQPSQTFEEALRGGDVTAIKDFLETEPARIRKPLGKGESLLHLAVESDKAELIAFLVERGADLEARDKAPGSTPLHRAAIYGKAVAGKALLKAGANKEAGRTVDRLTPLQTAVLFDKEEIVKLLLEAGADAKKNLPGGTSLLNAARKNNCRKVIPLLEQIGKK